VGLLDRVLGKTPKPIMARVNTADDPCVIAEPRIAFLNLLGGEADAFLAQDRAALAPFFASAVVSHDATPNCDVLVLYCSIDPNGRVASSELSLRQMIRDSGAVVALVATDNSGESYIAAGRKTGFGTANLVFTLERRGDLFTPFFRELFGKMAAGVTMPFAWVELVPQTKGAPQHESAPETFFVCEAGHVAFAPPALTSVSS
jgi:hypothetical protein